ncbi:hypothetical protein BDP27DRAFT_134456 [Rhodocollybia butyracea]|uniref:HIT domain-containing protein n=1 Tax=Rhodocollybia butyracea TaxID=206335 RepID=A0A9P5PMC8_9AGAR|nr:hypothetical protein BDP27DRAFT_134456 [Rhodocollybia butyracea]
MSYFHFFVIPTQKVYNIVSLTDSAIIHEMISHFKTFWAQPGAAQKCIDRINLAVTEHVDQVLAHLDHEQKSMFNEVVKDVRKYADECSVPLRTLNAEDFVFGFHAMPDSSVGHLHMHVLPLSETFRRFSTDAHDVKTIPARAVIEVLDAETEGDTH